MPVKHYKGFKYHLAKTGYYILTGRGGPRRKRYKSEARLKRAIDIWERQQYKRDKIKF